MTIEVSVELDFRPGKRLQAFAAAIDRLTQDKEYLGSLFKDAIRQSILEAYAERFEQATTKMLDTQKEDLLNNSQVVKTADLVLKLKELQTRHAKSRPGSGERALIEDKLARISDLLAGSKIEAGGLTRNTTMATDPETGLPMEGAFIESAGGGALSTGQFRPRMQQIIKILTDPALVKVQETGEGLVIGVGDLLAMGAVQTPSASGIKVGKRPTTSAFTTMWRQLEFGTGVYAKAGNKRTSGLTKSAGGRWWYGPALNQGLHIRGTQPGSFISKQDGEGYASDFKRFEARFGLQIERALLG